MYIYGVSYSVILYETVQNYTDIQMVAECQAYFGFDLPSVQLARRTTKFLDRHNRCRPTAFST